MRTGAGGEGAGGEGAGVAEGGDAGGGEGVRGTGVGARGGGAGMDGGGATNGAEGFAWAGGEGVFAGGFCGGASPSPSPSLSPSPTCPSPSPCRIHPSTTMLSTWATFPSTPPSPDFLHVNTASPLFCATGVSKGVICRPCSAASFARSSQLSTRSCRTGWIGAWGNAGAGGRGAGGRGCAGGGVGEAERAERGDSAAPGTGDGVIGECVGSITGVSAPGRPTDAGAAPPAFLPTRSCASPSAALSKNL